MAQIDFWGNPAYHVGMAKIKVTVGLISIVLCILFFHNGCFLTSSAEDYDIRGSWNLTAVISASGQSASSTTVFSGTKESGNFAGNLWGKIDDPGNYTVQGKNVTLARANHPPDDDGMNAVAEFKDADTVSGTWSDYTGKAGTWNMTRAD
jgi:hypothetical protein